MAKKKKDTKAKGKAKGSKVEPISGLDLGILTLLAAKYLTKKLAAHGLYPNAFFVLNACDLADPRVLTAADFDISETALSDATRKLVKDGYLNRIDPPITGGKINYQLTQEGFQEQKEIARELQTILNLGEIESVLTPRDIEGSAKVSGYIMKAHLEMRGFTD